jgi:hypothetical protein
MRRFGSEDRARLERMRAERALGSLRFFMRAYTWPVVEPATEYVHSWNIDAVCAHLEAVTAGELSGSSSTCRRERSRAPLTSVAWTPWEWLRKPSSRWVFASYGERLSTRDSASRRGVWSSRLRYQRALRILNDAQPRRRSSCGSSPATKTPRHGSRRPRPGSGSPPRSAVWPPVKVATASWPTTR